METVMVKTAARGPDERNSAPETSCHCRTLNSYKYSDLMTWSHIAHILLITHSRDSEHQYPANQSLSHYE